MEMPIFVKLNSTQFKTKLCVFAYNYTDINFYVDSHKHVID